MAWIKFEKDLLTDPRVLRIARSLQNRWSFSQTTIEGPGYEIGNDVALPAVTLVCGALVRIWSLADTHLAEDDLLPLGIDELDEVVGIPGFCEMLPEDWIVKVDDNTVKLPDFHAHNGTEAKKKAVTQKRVARFRAANAKQLLPRNAVALPDQTRPDQTISKERSAANRGTRLSIEVLPEDWKAQCKTERPDLDPENSFKGFRDYWIAVPGSRGVKLDWAATWRNWIRRETAPKKPNGGGLAANWWASNEGIQAKAVELGIEPRKGEGWNDLKARVSAKLEAH